METSRAFYFFLLIVIVAPLFALGLSNHGLWTPDEPRVAEIGREMALSGNWAVPTLNKRPFLEEPPLYYASVALAFRMLGVSEATARVPSAVFALGGVLAVFVLGSMLFSARVGFLSGVVLATCAEYFRVAHWLVVDSALTCFVVLAMTFFMAAYRSGRPRGKLVHYILCYASCTLAFYTKGFIGIVMPGAAVLLFLILQRDIKEVLRMRLWLGVLIFVVMALPWFAALWQHGGAEYLRVYLVHNHLQRFLPGGTSGHHQPFYYYATGFPAGFLPWSILIVPVIYFCAAGYLRGTTRVKEGTRFAACWFLAGFLFLSFASTKRVLYLMPIFAPAALLTAAYIESTVTAGRLKLVERLFLWLFGGAFLAVGLAAVPLCRYGAKLYSIDASGKLLFLTIVLSAAVVLLSLFALRFLARRRPGGFWACSVAALYALLLFALVVVVPQVDRHKSLAPFCSQVKAAVSTGGTLYAYKPDETLRGAVPFYTGYHVKEIENIDELRQLVMKEKRSLVVIRDSHRRLEKELLSSGGLAIKFRYDLGADRSYVLLTTTWPDSRPSS